VRAIVSGLGRLTRSSALASERIMDAPWRIELLGCLRATRDDRVVTRFQTHKTGALLAYLAYHCQRPIPARC
jgi:hypothetical protein